MTNSLQCAGAYEPDEVRQEAFAILRSYDPAEDFWALCLPFRHGHRELTVPVLSLDSTSHHSGIRSYGAFFWQLRLAKTAQLRIEQFYTFRATIGFIVQLASAYLHILSV